MRKIEINTQWSPYAEGSAEIIQGNTRVLCTASIEDRQPRFLVGTKKGWITAEYGMLPRSTHSRRRRDSDARGTEIQRLISRSLRRMVNLDDLRGFTISVDCDVLSADGGTRCASITAGSVALAIALQKIDAFKDGRFDFSLITAISVGLNDNKIVLDMDYDADSDAGVDGNFVYQDGKGWVEVQSTAENEAFSTEQLLTMMQQAQEACESILTIQRQALAPHLP